MTLVSTLINSWYGGYLPTRDTAVLANHALATIKVDVGDSPPWSPQNLYAAENFVSHQTDFFNSR